MLAVPLLGVLIVAEVVLSGLPVVRPSNGSGLSGFDPLTLGFLSILVLSVLFYELKRHGEQAARLLMAGMTTAGTLSGLVLLQLWFAASNKGQVLFYLLAAPLGYLGLYWSFRYYTGSLSKRKTSLLRIASATLLGSLLGAFFPVLFTILLLLALSLLDVLFVESNLLRKIVGLGTFDSVLSVTTLPLSEFDIGLGDLLAYSMLAASSLLNSGVYVAGATVALILSGAFITFRITKSRLRVPGLPIPLWLGLVPTVLGMVVA